MPNSPCPVEFQLLDRDVHASYPDDTSLLLATPRGNASQHRFASRNQPPSLVSSHHLRPKAQLPMVNRFLNFLKEE